jgi:hypothetical protein
MSTLTVARPGPEVRRRLWVPEARTSLVWLVPLLVLTGGVLAVGLGRIPQRIDDEGTYVAQAYAVLHYGELAHYTYFYDHPPLGWIQMAGWFGLTGGLTRYSSAVLAGREFVVVATVVAAALLWLLARRLGLGRPAAAAAVALFALSPLAVQFHRTVYLDNVATPWLLGAFLLVLTPRRQLLGHTGAAVTFAVAVLSKETFLLFLPFLVWAAWQRADPTTRRYTFSVASAVLALAGAGYVLFATLKGELVPAPQRTSLLQGVFFQLVGRNGSGSPFDPASLARVTVDQWWALDPVFLVLTSLAAVVALRDRRLRPFAAAVVFLAVFALRPGYLPVPYVVALLPLGALLMPAVAETALRGRTRTVVVATATTVAVAVAVATPIWTAQLRGLLLADLDAPTRQAQAWVEQNVGHDQRLIVDDALWVDLVRAGFERDDVVWYYKVDTDPAVIARAPRGWTDYDYVVSTNSLRTFPDGFPVVARALTNATPVASFGAGDTAVVVYRVNHAGTAAAVSREAAGQTARVAAGTELVRNPDLRCTPAVRDLLTGGRVDGRVMTVLAAAAARVPGLAVEDAPAVQGEETTPGPRRQLVLTAPSADGVATALRATAGSLAPASVERAGDTVRVTWPLGRPADVLTGTPS